MKSIKKRLNKQHGAAALLTSVVLLICITLVILLTAKTVLVETQITSDNYRTSQAASAASAAMNHGIAYFMEDGLDHDGDDAVDFTIGSRFNLTLNSGGQQTTAQFYYDNNPGNACDCPPPGCMATTNMTEAMIIARGWSDDGVATRTISQCLTTFDIFDGGEGPKQPFVSRQSVGVAGNARIINRYTNSSVWSGGSIGILGASFGTYLRPSNTLRTDYTKAELDDEDETVNTQRVSDRDSGVGIDVITNDPTLGNKTPDQLFDMFFTTTKTKIMNLADSVDQKFAVGVDLDAVTPAVSGVVWVGDNSATPSTTDTTISTGDVIGSPDKPVILIINGDLKMTGGTVHGVIYVMGELTVTGNPIMKGSLISESGNSSGTGTLNLVYVPYGEEGDPNPAFIKGTGAVVSGSWTDW
ncbi:hypothetical protein [Methylomarinum vadi]|uniref:hypothetical protein n=1 Tax=Methylomarinum vadi TaxID=438855 RepID=UPI00056A0A52|nr:hypothetical protein [Methylomarinum vadi]